MKKIYIIMTGVLIILFSGCSASNTTRFNGEKLVYFSGSNEIAVQAVPPHEPPAVCIYEWLPLSDDVLYSASNVFVGSVSDIQEISMTYEYMEQKVTDYWSLITVAVKSAIKVEDEMWDGSSITVLFEVSSYQAEVGLQIETDKDYVFFLKKTSEVSGLLDYTPIADFLYCIPANNFIPVNEKQNTDLLALIGEREDCTGNAFIRALEKFYE